MFTYRDFVFIKDDNGEYQYVDCSKKRYDTWKTIDNWNNYDKNDKIVIFNYQGKILGDTVFFALAFTSKENFDNRFNDTFDFNKICRIGEFQDFICASQYLIYKFGYKKENIFEENGNINKKFRFGIFNI